MAPVNDGERIYLALKTAHVAALAPSDGHELWRIAKDVTAAMTAADGTLFLPLADAIEAVRTRDGASLWVAPRIQAVAPPVASGGLLLVATETGDRGAESRRRSDRLADRRRRRSSAPGGGRRSRVRRRQ